MLRCLIALAALLLPALTSARTWHITPDGTGDAPTIQAGITRLAWEAPLPAPQEEPAAVR